MATTSAALAVLAGTTSTERSCVKAAAAREDHEDAPPMAWSHGAVDRHPLKTKRIPHPSPPAARRTPRRAGAQAIKVGIPRT